MPLCYENYDSRQFGDPDNPALDYVVLGVNDDTQALIKRMDGFRTAIADVRTILEDHDRRLGREREAGDG